MSNKNGQYFFVILIGFFVFSSFSIIYCYSAIFLSYSISLDLFPLLLGVMLEFGVALPSIELVDNEIFELKPFLRALLTFFYLNYIPAWPDDIGRV